MKDTKENAGTTLSIRWLRVRIPSASLSGAISITNSTSRQHNTVIVRLVSYLCHLADAAELFLVQNFISIFV
jgi:hypothetical protein